MKRSEKEEVVAEVSEVVRSAKAMYFTDFTGLTVAQATDLRKELRKAGADYRVVKNTLIKKALGEEDEFAAVRAKLVGPTGVAFAHGDAVAPAKVIRKFLERHDKLLLKVAVLEGRVYDGSKLKEIAGLPSRSELMAGILGSIQAPLAGVPSVVNAVLRDLVSVIGEIEKKKVA